MGPMSEFSIGSPEVRLPLATARATARNPGVGLIVAFCGEERFAGRSGVRPLSAGIDDRDRARVPRCEFASRRERVPGAG